MGQSEYLAFSDEAYYTGHRYRGISVISLPASSLESIRPRLLGDLSSSGISEFEWKKLASARERFAAHKLIDTAVGLALSGHVRIDTVVWDTHDSRHTVQGRDDIKNLERMYFHIFKAILKYRWPAGAKWNLHPDQNSAVDWASMHEFLEFSGSADRIQRSLTEDDIRALISNRDFNVRQIEQVSSSETPEVQVCDLFAGLGVYSHSDFRTYRRWCENKADQLKLPFGGIEGGSIEFTRSQNERCEVVSYLDEKCKKNKLHVGLASSAGFQTHNPRMPINFWPYTPQHAKDKAPVKSE